MVVPAYAINCEWNVTVDAIALGIYKKDNITVYYTRPDGAHYKMTTDPKVDITTAAGRAILSLLEVAMENGYSIDINDDYGTLCDDFQAVDIDTVRGQTNHYPVRPRN